MRLDKFLKVSRIIKRRTVANEAADGGRISVNGKVVKKSRLNDVIVDGQEEYDVSIPRQRDVMAILNEDMVALRKLCEEYQREMPTQIKLIYDVAANSLNADYSYDIIYSNDKDKMADDILEEWFESEKSKEE